MSQIERSAQQINQIIGVIDEIAFQTNLLAQRSGEAAKEINLRGCVLPVVDFGAGLGLGSSFG